MTTLKRLNARRMLTRLAREERRLVPTPNSRKSTRSWIVAGWFWVSVLLVLPNCTFSSPAASVGPNLAPGPEPRDAAIFCDIERERRCATPEDKAMGIRLAAAAVALNTGQPGSHIGLDESPEARERCGGEPEAVVFHGTFPKGYVSCVNCGSVIGTFLYPDAQAACVAQCLDFFGTLEADGTLTPQNPPNPANRAYCETNARVAANQPLDSCFAGACSIDGSELPGFLDPRRLPEAVEWTNLIGTSANGNNLTKTTPSSPVGNAGAASTQRFTRGDGFVEFSSSSATLATFVGFGTDPAGCAPPCNDTDPTPNDVSHGIALHRDGRVYIAENGTVVPGPGLNGSYRTYTAGQRFRVSVQDNSDGTAKVTYARVIGSCTPGMPCGIEIIRTSTLVGRYPLRVDSAFPDQGATVTDVRIVRIQN